MFTRFTETMQLMFRRPLRSQFAALCWRASDTGGVEVLLLTSRDTGRWVIPKGWPMGNKPGFAVAEQEAFEEAGVRGIIEQQALGCFGYDKMMDEGLKMPCQVQVHALQVTQLSKSFKEQGVRELAWVSCDEAARRVNEPELKALLLAFAKRFAG